MEDKFNNKVGPELREQKKGPGKLMSLLAFFSVVLGLSSATQFFAHDFRYQTLLGSNFNHIYAPWDILIWATKWHQQYPDAIIRAGSVGIFGAGIGLLVILIIKMIIQNSSKENPYLHGSARWATIEDIRETSLLPPLPGLRQSIKVAILSLSFFIVTMLPLSRAHPLKKLTYEDGVYVGAWIDDEGEILYLRHCGPEHVLCYAPTRSGKGVGLVVPTLLSWRDSTVVADLKGELWELTAGWRQKHAKNKVLKYEPAKPDSVRWNPLSEIRLETEYEVGDVQNLATILVDPDGKGLESHWQKTSQALFVGLILHSLYKAKIEGTYASLSTIDELLSDPEREATDLWVEMTTYPHKNGKNYTTVGRSGRDMLNTPEEEAGSILSTARSALALYRDPIVADNVSTSDFKIKDLMHHDSPVSLYIVTKPTDKARMRPLVRVLLAMIVRLSADELSFKNGRPVANYKHRLLLMIDEFPSLGKLQIIQESLAFVAGYGIKCYLICQDIAQLKSKEEGYGPDETITANCHVQVAFPPNKQDTAEYLSKLTGTTTVVKEQITTSGKRVSILHSNVSRTLQETQRPLLTPDECRTMPGPKKKGNDITEAGDMVVYVAGFPAIYGKQPLYFKDDMFLARAAVGAPDLSDTLYKVKPKIKKTAIAI